MYGYTKKGLKKIYSTSLNRFAFMIISIFSLFIVAGYADEFGIIKGQVLDAATQNPLPHANVILIGTQRGAATDKNGEFIIHRVPAGDYQIKVTYLSYGSETKQVKIKAGEEFFLKFSLREDFFQTQQVVVTATRSQKLLEEVPVVTELISKEEIEEKGAEDLSAILEDRPGISIESGSAGERFLYMNGVDSKRILLLVDNIPVSGKLNNRNQLNLVDADKIDHIEIIKGPGSALYGNDAMGGVINVITKGFSDGYKIQANGRLGSKDLYSGNLSFSGKNRGLNYAFNADHAREGFDKGSTEIDVKENQTSSVDGKIRFQSNLIGGLELRSEYREDKQLSESAFMGGLSDNESKIKNTNTSLVWNRNIKNKFQIALTGYYSDNLRSYRTAKRNSTRPATIDTTKDKISGFKSDFSFNPLNQLKVDFGFDFSSNDYENERLTETKNRQQTGYFSQIEMNFIKNFTFNLGGRYDKITDLSGYFSPRVSAMYDFPSGLKIRSSWGNGFRAPSFIELYSDFPMPIPGMPLRVVGNPELKPEKSTGGNLGFEYSWNSFLLVNATFFQNQFTDMIVDYQPQKFTYSYLNVESATFRGVELQTRFYLRHNLTTTLSYNFTDISQKDEDVAFSKISPHTAALRLTYSLFKNRLKFSLRDQFFGDRDILIVSGQTGDFSKEKKAAYNLVDFTGTFKLSKMLSLRLGGTNLTNFKDDEYGPYIGRRVFAGISTTFEKD
jgi:outer membrane receptor for ferrienterochelin and colicins